MKSLGGILDDGKRRDVRQHTNAKPLIFIGGADGDRTHGLSIRSLSLGAVNRKSSE
jgi:hypothetical protein